jgi:hypothetical protein
VKGFLGWVTIDDIEMEGSTVYEISLLILMSQAAKQESSPPVKSSHGISKFQLRLLTLD